MSTVTNYKFED